MASLPKRDEVVLVGKGHDALGVGLGDGEEMLQDVADLEIRTAPSLCYPLAELRFELVEHQMRVGFGNSALVLQIVAQDDVEEGEVGRRPVGKVRDDHAVWRLAVKRRGLTWFTAVLVQDNQVRDVVGFAGFDNVLHNVVAAIDSLGVGNHQADFLGAMVTIGWRSRIPWRISADGCWDRERW